MKRRNVLPAIGTAIATLSLALVMAPAWADDGLAVIAHPGVRGLDAEAIRRVYSGRMVELEGQPLRPLQLATGHPLRRRFATAVLQQSDEDFIAYWTVRRYIGKGAPPRELGSSAEVIAQVIATPGAIGYVDATDLKPGLHVVLRR
jgi:ABC-type phosphate transport system substrate-binding protein